MLRRMFLALSFVLLSCIAASAQGGVSAGAAIPSPTGSYSGLPAPYLYNTPAWCSVSANSAYLPTAVDNGANAVGCTLLNAGMIAGAVQLKPCTVTYATAITLVPGCSYSYIPMTGNILSTTLPAGTDGASQVLTFCSTGALANTFALPTTVRGTITSLLVALNKCTVVTLQYQTPLTAWIIQNANINI